MYICGTVWMETVPETYLADYKVDTDIDKGTVTVTPFLNGRMRAAEVEVSVSFGGKELAKGALGGASDAVEKYDSAAVRRLHQEILDAAKAGAEGR